MSTAAEIYDADYYQRLYDLETRHWWHLGMRRIAEVLVRSNPSFASGAAVLDAGCGTGASLTWARATLHASSITGIDISPVAIDFCRRRGLDEVSTGSVLELPFDDERFDVVLCWDVLQHLPTDGGDVRALRELRRVLKPGGAAILRANSRLGMWLPDDAKDVDYLRYTLPELTGSVRDAGLDPFRATYANSLPALYASARRWLERRQRRGEGSRVYEGLTIRDTATEAPRMNALLQRVIAAEARYLAPRGRSLPFGHTTFCVAVKR